MPECSVGRCGISCQFGCSCIQAGAGCECSCENISLPAFRWLRGHDRADPEIAVEFTATNMPLVRLAEWFDLLFPGQIMIPASRAREHITTGKVLEKMKLGDLIEHLGLVPSKKPLVGRTLADYKPGPPDEREIVRAVT